MVRGVVLLSILLHVQLEALFVVGWSPRLRPSGTNKFSLVRRETTNNNKSTISFVPVRYISQASSLYASASATATSSGDNGLDTESTSQKSLLRRQGGLFSFKTKYGALNPFAIFYGLLSIFLGLFWYMGLTLCQVMNLISRERLDKQKRIPIFLTQLWGVTLLRGSRCNPKIENLHILEKFYKEKRPAMFVANHASWQDIPFLCFSIGWRNYKLIAKKELLKVPILSKAISVAGHITLDRTNRREQLKALKKGIDYLKAGVNLCTFPEGTRTRTGRLIDFKSGAFKMAAKAGAPIIPVALVGTGRVHPPNWMFPCRSGRKFAKVVVCNPVETKGKEESDVEVEVREAIIAALPEDQRPLPKN